MAAARSFERKQLNVSSPQWNPIFCNACLLPSSRLQFSSILFSSLSKRCNSHISINTRSFEHLMEIHFRSSMSNDITQAFWYHGAISRATAESLLELEGDFILRASCNNGQEQYVISCKSVRRFDYDSVQLLLANELPAYRASLWPRTVHDPRRLWKECLDTRAYHHLYQQETSRLKTVDDNFETANFESSAQKK